MYMFLYIVYDLNCMCVSHCRPMTINRLTENMVINLVRNSTAQYTCDISFSACAHVQYIHVHGLYLYNMYMYMWCASSHEPII